MITTIGFDADDTLWQNEAYFRLTQEHFANLLRDHAEPDHLMERLLAAERRNIGAYGFGVKGFTLSMIELLPHAREAVTALAQRYRIVLITKGDLLHQERKLAQSGLGDLFDAVEIVSDKTAATYRTVFARHGSGADQAMMVGNSLKSDVIPALEAGGFGVHVPHGVTWALEAADAPAGHPRFSALPDLGGLPTLVDGLGTPPTDSDGKTG